MAVPKETKEYEAVYGPLSLEITEGNVKKPKDSIILFLSAIGASLVTSSIGINAVWTAPIISKLLSNDTDINPIREPVTTFQIAMLTGLMPLGAAFGALLLTDICDIIGRKKTIMLISGATIIFNTLIAFSSHLYILYIARLLIGVGAGLGLAVVSIFLSEISEDHNRGMIGCFLGLSCPIGNLYAYVFGPMVSIKVYTLLCTVPNIINIACSLAFIPESPLYLASKGDRKETIKALERLRNKSASEVEKEYEMIVQTLNNASKEEKVTWRTMFSVRSLRNGLIISVILNILQQFSGIGAILAYAGYLFDASGVSLAGDTVAILIGITNICGVLLAIAIIERLGRRPLLMVSTLGGSIPHFLLGLFFYLKNANSQFVNNILWLPVVSVLLYIVLFAVGLAVIPPAMMSELFPSNAKSKGSSASCFVNFGGFCLVTTLFPIINQFIGPSWCLWSFGLMGAVSFLYVYFFVPEIKGKNLIEIQELLSK